jgi:translation initiation factor 5
MPLLLTKIEGKGNGIKTVIPNMTDVSKALSRPPTCALHSGLMLASFLTHVHPFIEDPTKFFGFELGAQTSSDEKTDRYIVNGAHNSDKLRELLDVFIDKFVLCGSCKNPETDLVLTKNDAIFRDCKACGQQTGIDMRHKLATFIIRNPPKKTKKSKGAHASAANGNNGGTGSPHSGEDGGSDDEFTKRLKADAAELPTAEQAKVNEDDWSLDTSAEAVRARKLDSAVASLTLGEGDDSEGEDADSPYTVVKLWVEENRTTITANDVFKKAQELGIDKKHRTLQVLGRSLFTDKIVQELPKFVVVLKKVM